MLVIYDLCAAQYQMTHGPILVRAWELGNAEPVQFA